jgi:hypothetical protein
MTRHFVVLIEENGTLLAISKNGDMNWPVRF